MKFFAFGVANLIALAPTNSADLFINVQVHRISTKGLEEKIGTLQFIQQEHGLEIKPAIHGLTPGLHAIHIHENGSCLASVAGNNHISGGEAGGHYSGKEAHNHNHHSSLQKHSPAGDLPELLVNEQGKASQAITSHRLSLTEIKGRSVVIHAKSEREGGGERIACGVIE